MNYLTRDPSDGKIKPLCQWCRVASYNKTGRYADHISRASDDAVCANCGIPHTETTFDANDNPMPKPKHFFF